MYYIPAGQTMKLHDHPGMEVISYLFKGRMEARLFTQVKDDLYRKRTINLQKGSVSFIDGYKGN
jgi:redox-sensitive bicupin YhaK (pirin superfamily)